MLVAGFLFFHWCVELGGPSQIWLQIREGIPKDLGILLCSSNKLEAVFFFSANFRQKEKNKSKGEYSVSVFLFFFEKKIARF